MSLIIHDTLVDTRNKDRTTMLEYSEGISLKYVNQEKKFHAKMNILLEPQMAI